MGNQFLRQDNEVVASTQKFPNIWYRYKLYKQHNFTNNIVLIAYNYKIYTVCQLTSTIFIGCGCTLCYTW